MGVVDVRREIATTNVTNARRLVECSLKCSTTLACRRRWALIVRRFTYRMWRIHGSMFFEKFDVTE